MSPGGQQRGAGNGIAQIGLILRRLHRRIAEQRTAGSSLKLCLVAGGQADLYPRLGPTMEWDIAAGHAILLAGGGWLGRLDNHQPLQYGKADLKNPPFLAAGRQPAADVCQP
jgi:3'(2'), 5'-bisphosphate nucleotidase